MATDLSMVNLLDVLYSLRDCGTRVKRTAMTRGGNWSGPCPACFGKDRLYILPNAVNKYTGHPEGKWACRNCHPKESDAIEMLVYFDGLSYADAFKRLRDIYPNLPSYGYKGKQSVQQPIRIKPMEDTANPPSEHWQRYANDFLTHAQKCLWSEQGQEAMEYLRDIRKLTEETIRLAGLGFCPPVDGKGFVREAAHWWGLDTEYYPDGIYVPSGILFPYWYRGDLWKLRIRRLGDNIPKDKRYSMISGSSNGLYNADSIQPGHPVVLLEGEIDALSVKQSNGVSVACVATGSTTQARIPLWRAKLVLASTVLICFDNDSKSETTTEAIAYWKDRLEHARVHAFPDGYKDANVMLQHGADIGRWIRDGLADAHTTLARAHIATLRTGHLSPDRPSDLGQWTNIILDIEHMFMDVEKQCRGVEVLPDYQVVPKWKPVPFENALAFYAEQHPEVLELYQPKPFEPRPQKKPVDHSVDPVIERVEYFQDLGIRFSVENGQLHYEADWGISQKVSRYLDKHSSTIIDWLQPL